MRSGITYSDTAIHSIIWSHFTDSVIPAMIIDTEGNIVNINPPMLDILGFSNTFPDNVFSLLDAYFPNASVRKDIEHILRQSISHHTEKKQLNTTISRPDGSQRHLDNTLIDIMHEGTPTGHFLIISADVTEKKHMCEALRESERMYRCLVTTAPDGIVQFGIGGDIIELNSAFSDYFNLEVDEMRGHSVFDYITDLESRLHIEHSMRYLGHGGKHAPREILIGAHAGPTISVELSMAALKDGNGDIFGYIAITRDTTERLKAESALKESEQKYRDLVENISDIVFITDENGIITFVSKTVENIVYYTEHELLDNDFRQFLHPEDIRRASQDFNRAAHGELQQAEYRIITKNDDTIWMMITIRPIFEKKTFIGTHGFATNITELKLAEEELKSAREELLQKSKHLEDTNTALKVLLHHQEEEKQSLENTIRDSINSLVRPYILKMMNGSVDDQTLSYLKLVDKNLSEVTNHHTSKLAKFYARLTPTEIQIANLIRENKSTREIAEILCISETTVFFHRRNIRDKLGLKNNTINLKSYLQTLDKSALD